MTKDVLVTVKGLQYAPTEKEEDQRIETITRGTYCYRNDKHFVSYEESTEDNDVIKSLAKFDDDFFELTKKGAINTHMLFEEGKKNYTDYVTPFGDFVIGIDTNSIEISKTDTQIEISIIYDMEMNYEHLAKCRIDMTVASI